MAFILIAMAFILLANGLQPNSDGLQPNSDGLHRVEMIRLKNFRRTIQAKPGTGPPPNCRPCGRLSW